MPERRADAPTNDNVCRTPEVSGEKKNCTNFFPPRSARLEPVSGVSAHKIARTQKIHSTSDPRFAENVEAPSVFVVTLLLPCLLNVY